MPRRAEPTISRAAARSCSSEYWRSFLPSFADVAFAASCSADVAPETAPPSAPVPGLAASLWPDASRALARSADGGGGSYRRPVRGCAWLEPWHSCHGSGRPRADGVEGLCPAHAQDECAHGREGVDPGRVRVDPARARSDPGPSVGDPIVNPGGGSPSWRWLLSAASAS